MNVPKKFIYDNYIFNDYICSEWNCYIDDFNNDGYDWWDLECDCYETSIIETTININNFMNNPLSIGS